MVLMENLSVMEIHDRSALLPSQLAQLLARADRLGPLREVDTTLIQAPSPEHMASLQGYFHQAQGDIFSLRQLELPSLPAPGRASG
ncbi:hypothetical protein DYH09_03650 [bacterium CPR1]|nr:hypothetical protein [bacterium CPR1]